MPTQAKKPLMRSLGEAVGHIIKAIRTDPAKRKQTVRKTIEEQQRGDMILRRTTIEEVELRNDSRRGD
jgi:hypothetical protein